jgi:hypothetical protein
MVKTVRLASLRSVCSQVLQIYGEIESTETQLPEVTCVAASEQSIGISDVIDLSRYNSLNKLLRVSAYVMRFMHNLKAKQNRKLGGLTAREISCAELTWIRDMQNSAYSVEIVALKAKHQVDLFPRGRIQDILQGCPIPILWIILYIHNHSRAFIRSRRPAKFDAYSTSRRRLLFF